MSVETMQQSRAGQQDLAGGPGVVLCGGLEHRFKDKLALAGVDLRLGPGGVTGLLGPNGSGKSTLMRCLTGLVRADRGHASVDGVPVRGDGTRARTRLTYAPGELHLYGEMRGDEHLDWLLRGRRPEARQRSRELAMSFGLPLEKRVRAFSHGMKRQLCFAAAMGPALPVRILDEPTEGLDPSRRGQVLEALREDALQGTTILLSSHHLGEVDRVCDRILFMNEGQLIADETPSSVHERAARLLHLGYSSAPDPEQFERELGGAAARLSVSGTRVSVLLEGADPRPFLRALAARDTLPAPIRIEHGQISMQELYRDLYGVEGV